MEKLIAGLLIFIGALCLIPIFALIGAIPLYFLWNWLMSEIFALKAITFWQAFGLVFLTSILFKSTNTSSK
jgi:hypothetical protein